METGVATRPIADFDAYREKLSRLRLPLRLRHEADLRCGQARACQARPKRLVFAEGEHPYVLQAAQQVITERLGAPDPGRPARGDHSAC